MLRRHALPALCIVIGLGLTCNLASGLCFNGGILLMLTACLIWMRRLEPHR